MARVANGKRCRLIGSADLSQRWGISRQAIHKMHEHRQMPPAENVGNTLVWHLVDIERYEQATGRTPVYVKD